jgi:undecaprenyl-diphosphatase
LGGQLPAAAILARSARWRPFDRDAHRCDPLARRSTSGSPRARAPTVVIFLEAVLLGIVQGLTEFLPVSSSAHLILARAFFGWDADQFGLSFDVACHLGTLLAILAFFRADLVRMIAAIPRMVSPGTDDYARLDWLIVIGTIPVVIVGLLLRNSEDALRTPVVAGAMLAIGGVLLILADRWSARVRSAESLGYGEAVALGFAQSAALVPGVSRSGATITLALFLGLKRDVAARFSFLLGIPAISAAAVHEGLKLVGEPMPARTAQLFLLGILVSAIVGYVTIKFFLQYLAHHSISVFGWYRLALAATVVIWLVSR